MSKEREHCEAVATGFQRDRMLRQSSGSLADIIARERAARWNEALEAAANDVLHCFRADPGMSPSGLASRIRALKEPA